MSLCANLYFDNSPSFAFIFIFLKKRREGTTGTWLDAPIELALAREVTQRAVLETLCMAQALNSKAATELELDMWTSVTVPHRLLALRIVRGGTLAEALHSLFEEHTQLMVNALLEEQQL